MVWTREKIGAIILSGMNYGNFVAGKKLFFLELKALS